MHPRGYGAAEDIPPEEALQAESQDQVPILLLNLRSRNCRQLQDRHSSWGRKRRSRLAALQNKYPAYTTGRLAPQ
eukprot:6198626-Pleurochrysis_carterae.AAC.2